MPAEKIDAFLQSFNIELSDDAVRIRMRPKQNLIAWIAGVIMAGFFFFLGFTFGGIADTIFFILLGIVSLLIAFNMNSNGLYPNSELSLRDLSVTKLPTMSFLKHRVRKFGVLKGISFATKAISGHTSAYEEGNTDYRKSILLETDSGDITLMTYYGRNDELEPSAKEFVNYLEGKITSIAQ